MDEYPGKDTPYFSLKGTKGWARVVGVYDGDTITIVMKVGDGFLKFKSRLEGIDTCEMKSTNKQLAEKAQTARKRLVELITGDPLCTDFESNRYMIYVECGAMDKYGRLLVNCYEGEDMKDSFSVILVRENLAYVYYGKTKQTETEQLKTISEERL